MTKSKQYVDVDREYISKSKNEDTKTNYKDELKSDVDNFYKGFKDALPGNNDQEKMRNAGRKSLKFAKGYFVAILVFSIIIAILILVLFAIGISEYFNTKHAIDETDDMIDGVRSRILDSMDEMYGM